MNPTDPSRTVRMTQESSRASIPVTGPNFSIQSGAFGGEWDSSRGDLENPIQSCADDDD